MSFVAILIALLIERFFDCSHLRHWSWYQSYQAKVSQKFSQSSAWVMLAITVLPIVVAVLLVSALLSGVAFGFAKFVFSVLIILFCFGPRNLWADTFACLNALFEGDKAAAIAQLKASFGMTMHTDSEELHREWVGAIFTQANSRVFAQVFWFVCLGLFGAVLYQLIAMLANNKGQVETDQEVANVAGIAKSYLEWPTVRVLAFLFALGGNYSRVFPHWRNRVVQGPMADTELLVESGIAALGSATEKHIAIDGSAEKEAISIIDRSLVILLVVIIVLALLLS